MSKNIYESKQERGLKILTPKQLFQRLPLLLAEIPAGNNSKDLLNEIRQIVYSLYQSKEAIKKYIITSNQQKYKMDIILLNSENSRTSEYPVLLIN